MKIRVGTRGSRLALVQARAVEAALRHSHPGLDVELVIIQTTGDRILDAPLAKIGGKGVFTKEIENALHEQRIDVAVHSLKDVPTIQPEGLALAAVTKRENPFDVLLSAKPLEWGSMPAGFRIGTSSLRRRAMIRAAMPGVEVEELRGNVPTRIEKMLRGEYDAIILAEAGVSRLGLDAPYRQILNEGRMLPAPGQGSLGLQVRADDSGTSELLAVLHDADSAACCGAERALLHALGGGCQMPLGAHATIINGDVELHGCILSPDGAQSIAASLRVPLSEAESAGRRLAEKLFELGAREILSLVNRNDDGFDQAIARSAELDTRPLGGMRVLVTRDEDTDGPLSRALRDLGAHPICMPCVAHSAPQDPRPLRQALSCIDRYTWLILTSARAVEALRREGIDPASIHARVACVGQATAGSLRGIDMNHLLVPQREDAEGLLAGLLPLLGMADNVLYPKSGLASDRIESALSDASIVYTAPVAYETVPLAPVDHLRAILGEGLPDAVTFASPSAVSGFARAAEACGIDRQALAVAVIGPSTARAAREHGFHVGAEAETQSFEALAASLLAR